MISISVDLDLDAISSIIDLTGNSESERREILDFVLTVDRSMCDIQWSLDLIAELATSLAQETIDEDWRKVRIPMPVDLPVPGIPDATVDTVVAIPVPKLARALAAVDPELAVQIYAESQELRKQELAKIEQAKAQTRCGGCGHTYSEHSGTCLAEESGLAGAVTWQCECSEFEEEE